MISRQKQVVCYDKLEEITMKANSMKTLALAVGLATIGNAMAEVYTVTGTVNNTVTIAQSAALALGDIALVGFDSTNASMTAGAITITPAGVTSLSPGDQATSPAGIYASGAISKFVPLGNQSGGTLDITGGANAGVISIDTSGTIVDLDSGVPGAPKILISAVTTLPSGSVTLDASGAGTINFGATFTADPSTTLYPDGVYTGSVDISVSY